MYEERRESFSVRDLILQVLFIVLFVFILIWLFPTKSYMKKYIESNKDSNTTNTVVESGYDFEQLAVLYNQIFANNVSTMKEAAVGYYTTDRLPEKVGDTEKLTLQQMYDKHLVLTVKDKDGKACDPTKSYVSVTKYEDEYQMKVNLSCGSEEDYIIVYLGCYDYCEASGVCEKQTTTTTTSKPSTSTPKKETNNKKVVQKVVDVTVNNYYENCDCERPKYSCQVVNGRYYDKNGNEVSQENYEKSCGITKHLCEYKKVTGGSWGDYGEWSGWTTTKITSSDNTQVQTKVEKVVKGYTTQKQQVGTKTETYIKGYTTTKYVKGYTTEKYVSGHTTEKYISGYTTQKVQTGTQRVQVGTTKVTKTRRVAAGTTREYVKSSSGPTVPSNTSEYVYVKTGSTTSQSCSGCANTTIYTWDVYKLSTVYKTETYTEDQPVYKTEPVYETKEVPVYSTRQVPVYSTRQVPVYGTKKSPVYATKKVPVYGTVKVPVYGTQTYYRSRTRTYKGGSTDIKWSTCDPVDKSLTDNGYYLTGNVKEV